MGNKAILWAFTVYIWLNIIKLIVGFNYLIALGCEIKFLCILIFLDNYDQCNKKQKKEGVFSSLSYVTDVNIRLFQVRVWFYNLYRLKSWAANFFKLQAYIKQTTLTYSQRFPVSNYAYYKNNRCCISMITT